MLLHRAGWETASGVSQTRKGKATCPVLHGLPQRQAPANTYGKGKMMYEGEEGRKSMPTLTSCSYGVCFYLSDTHLFPRLAPCPLALL